MTTSTEAILADRQADLEQRVAVAAEAQAVPHFIGLVFVVAGNYFVATKSDGSIWRAPVPVSWSTATPGVLVWVQV